MATDTILCSMCGYYYCGCAAVPEALTKKGCAKGQEIEIPDLSDAQMDYIRRMFESHGFDGAEILSGPAWPIEGDEATGIQRAFERSTPTFDHMLGAKEWQAD